MGVVSTSELQATACMEWHTMGLGLDFRGQVRARDVKPEGLGENPGVGLLRSHAPCSGTPWGKGKSSVCSSNSEGCKELRESYPQEARGWGAVSIVAAACSWVSLKVFGYLCTHCNAVTAKSAVTDTVHC